MEQNKKLRFNVLDLVIIIVAVACVAGLVIRSNLADKIIKSEEEAKITFLATNMLTMTVDEALEEGDVYYCERFNAPFGTLLNRVEFQYSPAKQQHEDKDGFLVESTLPYRSDVTGYMKATGYFDEDGRFLAAGVNEITPGASYEVYSENRRLFIMVLSVEPMN